MALCGFSAAAMVSAALFGERGVRKHGLLQQQLAELSKRRAELTSANARLAAEARALRESPEYVEWVIRQELGWIAEDERVLRLEP